MPPNLPRTLRLNGAALDVYLREANYRNLRQFCASIQRNPSTIHRLIRGVTSADGDTIAEIEHALPRADHNVLWMNVVKEASNV